VTTPRTIGARFHCTRARDASANAKMRSKRPPSATGQYTSIPSLIASWAMAASAAAPFWFVVNIECEH
jgi:hypothetical protein